MSRWENVVWETVVGKMSFGKMSRWENVGESTSPYLVTGLVKDL